MSSSNNNSIHLSSHSAEKSTFFVSKQMKQLHLCRDLSVDSVNRSDGRKVPLQLVRKQKIESEGVINFHQFGRQIMN